MMMYKKVKVLNIKPYKVNMNQKRGKFSNHQIVKTYNQC